MENKQLTQKDIDELLGIEVQIKMLLERVEKLRKKLDPRKEVKPRKPSKRELLRQQIRERIRKRHEKQIAKGSITV